jgi:glycosyltransferase involved in cell wall biosynthesis
MDNLPISVVTVAKNSEETISSCLISIQRNGPAEIIVVDGKSIDRTVEIARRYTTKIYSDEGRGLNHARQLGAQMATEQYIAYVDSDVTLTDGALETMLIEFRNSDFVSISAQQSPNRESSGYWEWAQYWHNQLRPSKNGLSLNSGLLRKETILQYGFDLSEKGLNKRMDDLDLEIRLRRDGCKFGKSSATVHVKYVANFGTLVRYRFFLGRVGARYIKKYGLRQIRQWPLLATAYWLGFCIVSGRLKLVPYFVMDGIAKTSGTLFGFFELVGEAGKKP